MRNHTKRVLVFRAFALANGLFVAIGLWRLTVAIVQAAPNLPVHHKAPYGWQFFFAFAACNLLLLAALVLTSVRLWQLLRGAVLHSTWVYAAIVLYNLVVGLGWALPDPWGGSVAMAVVAGANLGVRAFVWTGYPLLAAIALNITRHYTRMRSDPHGKNRQRKRAAEAGGSDA